MASIQRGLTTRERNTRADSSVRDRVLDVVGPGAVADVGARGGAGQRADRGHHAAVVLVVVVGVGDVVLAAVGVLDREPRSAGRRTPCPRGRPGRPGRGRRRGRPTPRRPRPGRRRPARTGSPSAAAGPRRRSPAGTRRCGWWPGAGRPAAPGRPARGRARSCRPGPRPARRRATASSSRVTTCGNASRKNPLIRTTTSMRGRPELGERDDLQAGDPAAGLVPDRPDPEQRQHLGDVVAGGAHGGRAPHRQPDRGRPLSPVSSR